MTIDKDDAGKARTVGPSPRLAQALVLVFVLSPIVTIMLALIAIEWGVAARVIKEGFNFGYDLLGF